MNDKCSKYEGLFIFSDDETLKKHLLECEDCRREQEKMDKVSGLIDEVKFHYYSKSKKKPIEYTNISIHKFTPMPVSSVDARLSATTSLQKAANIRYLKPT